MVSFSNLQEHTARRPFEPFWISLTNGETIFVTQPFRAVAMEKRFVVSVDGRTMRHIPIEQIADHGFLSERKSSGG